MDEVLYQMSHSQLLTALSVCSNFFLQCRKRANNVSQNHIVRNLVDAYLRAHPGKVFVLNSASYYISLCCY